MTTSQQAAFKIGTVYYYINLSSRRRFRLAIWCNSETDRIRLNRGIAFKSASHAAAAGAEILCQK